jgi:mono/diheme cytochrome c family protein
MRLRSLFSAGLMGLLLTPAALVAQTAGSGKPVEENYKATCQPCHMADGNAALKPMSFADGEWKHGTTPQALAKVIANGVPGTAMMPFKTRFSEKEILELARYVRKFDPKLKGGSSAPAKKKPAPPTQ